MLYIAAGTLLQEAGLGLAITFGDYYYCALNFCLKLFVLLVNLHTIWSSNRKYFFVPAYYEFINVAMAVTFIVIYYIKYRVELYQNDVRVVENQGLTYEQQIAFLT